MVWEPYIRVDLHTKQLTVFKQLVSGYNVHIMIMLSNSSWELVGTVPKDKVGYMHIHEMCITTCTCSLLLWLLE